MDDALVPKITKDMKMRTFVLILVLMDDALVRIVNYLSGLLNNVLILVLMDDALVPGVVKVKYQPVIECLNPCFNG